jgi:hypothetical protein
VNVGYLRPFGCRVYVTNPPEKQTKKLSEPRSWLGIFLGHEIADSTYRIWNPSTKTIRLVRDVVFHEDDFPARDKRFYQKNFGTIPRMQVLPLGGPPEAPLNEATEEELNEAPNRRG